MIFAGVIKRDFLLLFTFFFYYIIIIFKYFYRNTITNDYFIKRDTFLSNFDLWNVHTLECFATNTYSYGTALLTRYVEENGVLSDDDVGDAVAVVSDWPEPTARAYAIRVLFQIQHAGLT